MNNPITYKREALRLMCHQASDAVKGRREHLKQEYTKVYARQLLEWQGSSWWHRLWNKVPENHLENYKPYGTDLLTGMLKYDERCRFFACLERWDFAEEYANKLILVIAKSPDHTEFTITDGEALTLLQAPIVCAADLELKY